MAPSPMDIEPGLPIFLNDLHEFLDLPSATSGVESPFEPPNSAMSGVSDANSRVVYRPLKLRDYALNSHGLPQVPEESPRAMARDETSCLRNALLGSPSLTRNAGARSNHAERGRDPAPQRPAPSSDNARCRHIYQARCVDAEKKSPESDDMTATFNETLGSARSAFEDRAQQEDIMDIEISHHAQAAIACMHEVRHGMETHVRRARQTWLDLTVRLHPKITLQDFNMARPSIARLESAVENAINETQRAVAERNIWMCKYNTLRAMCTALCFKIQEDRQTLEEAASEFRDLEEDLQLWGKTTDEIEADVKYLKRAHMRAAADVAVEEPEKILGVWGSISAQAWNLVRMVV